MKNESIVLSASESYSKLKSLVASIESVYLGKTEVVRLACLALLAEGHLLIEDVPGLGKTLLAKAIAKSLACQFSRVQFTPDLLPGDLLGISLYNQQSQQFQFQAGPIFTEILLADEINRATPRTQSALLEAMAERQVTTDGTTRKLGPPFMVLATQNPFDYEGTYPLPESQLDRFLIRLSIGYPAREYERAILTQHRVGEPVNQLQPCLTREELLALQVCTKNVAVEPSVAEYILDLIQATRTHKEIRLGAGTRAALAFYRAVQAHALLHDRDYAIPDDVKQLAEPVLAHRILSRSWEQSGSEDTASIVREITAKTPVPR